MPLPAKLRADRHLRNQTWPFLPVAVRQERTLGARQRAEVVKDAGYAADRGRNRSQRKRL